MTQNTELKTRVEETVHDDFAAILIMEIIVNQKIVNLTCW